MHVDSIDRPGLAIIRVQARGIRLVELKGVSERLKWGVQDDGGCFVCFFFPVRIS